MRLMIPSKAQIEAPYVRGRSLGRHRTVDTAFTFRMGAGFAGDVNRGHPASIQPSLISPNNPVTAYGQPVVIDTSGGANGGVRPLSAGDTALTDIWGITVRPYPIQQPTTANNYGAVPYGGAIVPPALQPIDIMRGGYMMVSVVGAPARGGTVYIWCAASGGGHIQGGFEAAASGGNTATLAAPWAWNSPADSNGIAEIVGSRL
jgi:hypothetical protein